MVESTIGIMKLRGMSRYVTPRGTARCVKALLVFARLPLRKYAVALSEADLVVKEDF